jgi:hypothetical protein
MALTESQKKEIDNAFDMVNIQIMDMKKGLRDTTPRLEALAKDKFHIERLMVNAQLVEHALKGTLRMLVLKRTIWGILNHPDSYGGKTIPFFEKMELGKLISLYKKLEGENKLSKNLTSFKDRFRNDYIHHIFDGTNDLTQIDKEAEKYLNSEEFNQGIVMGLISVQLKLQKEIQEAIKLKALDWRLLKMKLLRFFLGLH